MSRTHALGLLLTLGVFAVSASGQEVQWRPAKYTEVRQPPPTRPSYIARGVATDEPTGPLLPAVPPLPTTSPARHEPTGPLLPAVPPLPTTSPARHEPTGPLLPAHPERLSPPDLGGVPPVLRDAPLPRPLPGVAATPTPPPFPPPGQARLLSAQATSTPIVQTPTRPATAPTPGLLPASMAAPLPAASAASRPLWSTSGPGTYTGTGTGAGTGEVWSPVTRVAYQPEPASVQTLPDLPGKSEPIGPPRDPLGKPDPAPSEPPKPTPHAPIGQAQHDDLWRAAPTVATAPTATGTGAGQQFWLRGEYLLWTVKPDQIPVLATTGPIGTFGFLGQPGVVPLLGPGDFNDGVRHGWRISGGVWLDDCMTCGLDFSVFALPRVSQRAEFNSTQFPVLTRPIFALNFNQEFGELVASPGIADGALVVDETSDLWGFDVNAFETLCCWCGFRANAFAGIRYLQLHETLRIQEFLVAGPNAPTEPLGTNIIVTDNFDTRNQFLGGQVGVNMERRWGNVIGEFRGKLALGGTRQTLRIDGSQFRRRPGELPVVVTNGGLLATPTNIGEFQRDRFSVVPEVFVSLGYQLTPNLRVFAGYNFLYWTNVIRPGSEVDRVVDLAFVPNTGLNVLPTGLNRPAPQFRDVDFWAQGLSLGIDFRW